MDCARSQIVKLDSTSVYNLHYENRKSAYLYGLVECGTLNSIDQTGYIIHYVCHLDAHIDGAMVPSPARLDSL